MGTGIYLETGTKYAYTFGGEVCFRDADTGCDEGSSLVGIEGWCTSWGDCSNAAYCERYWDECPEFGNDRYTQFPHAALLAGIRREGETEPVGSLVFAAETLRDSQGETWGAASGELMFMVNDFMAEDNTGEFWGTITVVE